VSSVMATPAGPRGWPRWPDPRRPGPRIGRLRRQVVMTCVRASTLRTRCVHVGDVDVAVAGDLDVARHEEMRAVAAAIAGDSDCPSPPVWPQATVWVWPVA